MTSTLYDLIQQIRPLHRVVERVVGETLRGTGVSVGMRAVLEALHALGPTTVPALATSIGVQRQYAQRMVDALVEAQLVERRANPAHRRSHHYAVTQAGIGRFADIHAREQRFLEPLLTTLTPADLATAARVLDTLSAHFHASSPEPP